MSAPNDALLNPAERVAAYEAREAERQALLAARVDEALVQRKQAAVEEIRWAVQVARAALDAPAGDLVPVAYLAGQILARRFLAP